jgi:cobalt-zinc-cadmium efflux system outer membrane protein
MVAQLERELNQSKRGVTRLLGRPLDTDLPFFALPEPAPAIVWSERLQKLTTRFEPRLQRLRKVYTQAKAETERTERNRFPFISVGADSRQYSGTGGFREATVGVRMSLPWFNRSKVRAELQAAREEENAARLEVEDMERFVPFEARRVHVMSENARRRAVLERDELLPRARLALQNSQEVWASGRSSFLELMEARRLLLQSQISHASAVAEQYSALAELALCCGLGDLEGLSMVGGSEQVKEGAKKNSGGEQ